MIKKIQRMQFMCNIKVSDGTDFISKTFQIWKPLIHYKQLELCRLVRQVKRPKHERGAYPPSPPAFPENPPRLVTTFTYLMGFVDKTARRYGVARYAPTKQRVPR